MKYTKESPYRQEELHRLINERFAHIAFYFHQSLGFPHDVFYDIVGSSVKTLLHQVVFINRFAEAHPKVIQPIHFSDIQCPTQKPK